MLWMFKAISSNTAITAPTLTVSSEASLTLVVKTEDDSTLTLTAKQELES